MRSLIALLIVALSVPALAQERAQLTVDVVALRFPDADHHGPTLVSGDEVVVLLRDGDRARVMKGSSYGWIPTAALGPVQAAPAPSLGGPGFDLEAIKRSLELGQESSSASP